MSWQSAPREHCATRLFRKLIAISSLHHVIHDNGSLSHFATLAQNPSS